MLLRRRLAREPVSTQTLILCVIGLYVVVAGASSLAGWAFDIARLTDWDNDDISIQPNATVAAIASGIALLLVAADRNGPAVAFACIVAAIGGATVFQYLSGVDLGIDTLLMFDRQWGRRGTLVPGRMGPPGSVSWTLIGTALLLAIAGGARRRQTAAILGVGVLAISGLSVIGYLFGADPLYTIPTLTVIAFQTATMTFAMAIGILAALPDRQPMRALVEQSAAGLLTRRLAPFVLLVPIVLGVIWLAGQNAGFYDTAMGAAMFAVAVISFLWAVLWWGAAAVREHELKLAVSMRALQVAADEREELLLAAQRARVAAETADRAKDEFLAVLSHELRSPLNAMLGWVHIMKRPGLDERLAGRAIETLERNIHIQTQVINDLLDITRIKSGRFELERSPVDVTAVVLGTVESLRPVAESRGLELECAIPGEPLQVRGDAARIEQVIANICQNAIKFTPEGGRISIQVSRVDRAVEIVIADTGQGIHQDLMPRIFDRFVQAQSATTRRHSGLGLGLAIVKQLVDLHGGSVRAESDGPGQGARFTVVLPLDSGGPAEGLLRAPRVQTPQPLATPLDVLVVEDDDDSREALRMALERSGAVVRVAGSVREALSAYDTSAPDVLISDIAMPDEDGYSLIQKIRERDAEKTRQTLAIAMTGFASRFDHDAALRAGFDEHVGKPVEAGTLLHTMGVLMASRMPERK